MHPAGPVVLVLAAGSGERFRAAGGQGHKLDALLSTPQGTRSVREHVLSAVQASGLPWHMVLPEHTAHHAVQGMGVSIATGVAATAHATAWLILPADLPLVQPDSLRQVAQALRQHPVVVPRVQGVRGHPVGFSQVCREALLALSEDEGARSVMQQHPVHWLDLQDQGITMDVDTPALLQQAQQWVQTQV